MVSHRNPVIARSSFPPNPWRSLASVTEWCGSLLAINFLRMSDVGVIVVVLGQVSRKSEAIHMLRVGSMQDHIYSPHG